MTAIRSRSLIWWAALGVALCGVVATAHGLFGVARACTVPTGIAALYVPLTDGLALVAYAATSRLRGRSRAYAWVVVLLGAGLSGVAQAVNLGGLGVPSVWLRYGVGAWPALAVAIVAHLLWLVSRPAEPVSLAHDEIDESSVHSEPEPEPVSPEPLRLAPPVSPEPGRVTCTAGCGRQVSLATYKRHKSKGCPAAAA